MVKRPDAALTFGPPFLLFFTSPLFRQFWEARVPLKKTEKWKIGPGFLSIGA
jgi:hypothetical protein